MTQQIDKEFIKSVLFSPKGIMEKFWKVCWRKADSCILQPKLETWNFCRSQKLWNFYYNLKIQDINKFKWLVEKHWLQLHMSMKTVDMSSISEGWVHTRSSGMLYSMQVMLSRWGNTLCTWMLFGLLLSITATVVQKQRRFTVWIRTTLPKKAQ